MPAGLPGNGGRIGYSCLVIDVKDLSENPDKFRASQRARGADESVVDAIIAADSARRAALIRFENLRAEQNAFGKKVAQAKGEEKQALLAEVKVLAASVKAASAEADLAQAAQEELLRAIPNLIEDGVPAGGEDDYIVVKTVGTPREFPDFEPKDHLEIGELIGAIDMERGAKVSGSRFYFLRGVGARLEMALLQMAMEQAIDAGFVPMITPTLVRPETMQGTGFDVKHDAEIYRLAEDDLYLVGTSEVALAGYHADEILDLSAGPIRYAGPELVLPPRGRLARQGHPRHHPGPPVQQGGDVHLHHGRGGRRRARPAAGLGRGDAGQVRAARTASLTPPPATWAIPPPGSSTARPGSPPRAPTGS